LALNTAVEVFPAGALERGLFVVADEVRIFSQKTHNSTPGIGKIISTSQDFTRTPLNSISDCYKRTTKSTDSAMKAVNIFDEIAGGDSWWE
jgi:methyl-accepting chemotaxis protein